jgi:hypothetical protein
MNLWRHAPHVTQVCNQTHERTRAPVGMLCEDGSRSDVDGSSRVTDWRLAITLDESEWQLLVAAVQSMWAANGAPHGAGYNGVWIGLSSPDPVPSTVPDDGPWQPASNWRWAHSVGGGGVAWPALWASMGGGGGPGWQGSAQPDNSGGQQRCVLIARSVGATLASRCVGAPSRTHTHARTSKLVVSAGHT